MNIALIQPPGWTVGSPPYNIALLKAILKSISYDVICFDLNTEIYDCVDENFKKDGWSSTSIGNCWLDREFVLEFIEKYKPLINEFISKVINMNPDVIGFTVINRSAIFTLEIAKMVKEKEPEKIIILGGPHGYGLWGGFSLIKELAVDAVCLGEGELCFASLLDIIRTKKEIKFCKGFVYKEKDNKIIDCGDPEIVKDLDSLPFADYSDFNIERYRRLPILTSKGCIYKCSFCNEVICLKEFRSRSGSNVYLEIIFQLSKYPHINEFHFCDSLINGNIKMLNELCDLIIKNNIRITWGGQAAIRKEMTKDFLLKLKRAGCVGLSYGVESGSNKVLRLMNKGHTAELAEEVLHNTHEAGIETNFNIIIGFPYETEVEFQETLNFLKRNSKYAGQIWLNVLNIATGSDLDIDRNKWGISEHTVGEWESIDGKNNYEERLRQLEICRNVIGEKAYTDAKSIDLLEKMIKP